MEGTTEHDGYDRAPTRPLTANGSSLQARPSVTGARSWPYNKTQNGVMFLGAVFSRPYRG